MRVIDKEYDEKTILRYTGSTESINKAERVLLNDGKAKNCEAIEVTTGGGLRVMILQDRGLDIASVSFRGVNISFLSKNGITGPLAVNPHEDEFLRYFAGGMLTTCGPRNAGPSCREENGEFHPLHGRYNTIPAAEVGIHRPSSEIIEITGLVRETALFGCNLKMKRTIRINNANSEIAIEDTLMNQSAQREEIMLLYHYNFGFPFLQNGSYLEFEENDQVSPRNEDAVKGLSAYKLMEEPDDHYAEQVFFHLQHGNADCFAKVKVISPCTGLFAQLRYDTSVLPVLAQWKSMKSGDYALGLEPTNNYIKGRVEERKNGTLQVIEPYSTITFRTALTFGTL